MFLDKQKNKTHFERLVEGFIPLSDDNISPFQLEDISFGSDTDPIKYPLSDEITYYCSFYSPEYEYCTLLEPQTIQKDYPQVKDHASLKAAIAEKAAKDISNYYDDKINEKYREIAQYISFVISCLMRFDLSELINLKPTNMENCKNALYAFHINPEEVFSIISEYCTDQTAMMLQVYHSIQGGLSSFLNTLKESGLHFALKFTKYLNEQELGAHIKTIESVLSSDNLNTVISIQKNEPEEIAKKREQIQTIEQFARENLVINELNHRYNKLFVVFEEVLKKYCKQLKSPNPSLDPFRGFNCSDLCAQDPDYPRKGSDTHQSS